MGCLSLAISPRPFAVHLQVTVQVWPELRLRHAGPHADPAPPRPGPRAAPPVTAAATVHMVGSADNEILDLSTNYIGPVRPDSILCEKGKAGLYAAFTVMDSVARNARVVASVQAPARVSTSICATFHLVQLVTLSMF